MLHSLERNKLAAPIAIGILESRIQFEAASLVNHEHGTTIGLNAPIKDVEHVFLGAKLAVEELIELFGPPHLHRFADHDRPGGDGEEDEADNDELGFGSSLLPHIKQFCFICISDGCG